jgi:hypothetical protein
MDDKNKNRLGDETDLLLSGGGFVFVPMALFRYARALGLSPDKVWLLLGRVRELGGMAYISQSKLERDTLMSRMSAFRLFRSLENKGLIVDLRKYWSEGDKYPSRFYVTPAIPPEYREDQRCYWDVQPTYQALALLIKVDPRSNYNLGKSEFEQPETPYPLEDAKNEAAQMGLCVNFDVLFEGLEDEETA